MPKVRGNVFLHEQGVTRYLIMGYTASGAKLAGISHRRLYGTRELIIARLIRFDGDTGVQGWYEMMGADWPVVVLEDY